jgi:hypothetical protein
MNLLRTYLVQTGEKTEIENLSAEALHEKFNTFLLSVTNSNSPVDNKIPKLGHRNSKNYQTYLELTYSRRFFGGG